MEELALIIHQGGNVQGGYNVGNRRNVCQRFVTMLNPIEQLISVGQVISLDPPSRNAHPSVAAPFACAQRDAPIVESRERGCQGALQSGSIIPFADE